MRSTMTVKETSEFLGVSVDTIYRMVRQKQIPHFRVRKRIFFRADSLEEWMRKQEGEAM